MKKVALSACLTGCSCRYDGKENLNRPLLEQLSSYEIIPFCPEDFCFGTPRPTMDLVNNGQTIEAISNKDSSNLSKPIINYAKEFFEKNTDIKLFIGKDRSPSCAVKSGKVYDKDKNLLYTTGAGLMAKVALDLGIESWDSEEYLTHTLLNCSSQFLSSSFNTPAFFKRVDFMDSKSFISKYSK